VGRKGHQGEGKGEKSPLPRTVLGAAGRGKRCVKKVERSLESVDPGKMILGELDVIGGCSICL